jgi:hypothetical protein
MKSMDFHGANIRKSVAKDLGVHRSRAEHGDFMGCHLEKTMENHDF